MKAPQALVVTSNGAPGSTVMPVMAALEVAGLEVRATDVGRAGSSGEGTVGRVVRAIAGEFAERRLEKEMAENSFQVAITFDPASTSSLTAIRDGSGRPVPVIAVVPSLAPSPAWVATNADRYLVPDDEVAVALTDSGVEGQRIMAVGPLTPVSYFEAAKSSRSGLKKRFKLAEKDPVVLIKVEGFGYDLTQQIALQLSLMGTTASYLFDAGRDTEAAAALRRQVPTLELKAKLFGASSEVPKYWRAADVIIARPTVEYVSRALVLGRQFLSLLDEGKDGSALASAVTARKLGATAASPLLISSALEPLLSRREAPMEGVDGAGNVADIAFVVASDWDAVVRSNHLSEHQDTRARVKQAAEQGRRRVQEQAAPGELEDLSGAGGGADFGDDFDSSEEELDGLRLKIIDRKKRAAAIVSDATKRASRAEAKATEADKRGEDAAAASARSVVDSERARMHAALGELAQLEKELEALAEARKSTSKAPPRARPAERSRRGGGTSTRAPRQSVDEMLDQLKRDAGTGAPTQERSRSRRGGGKAASKSPQSGGSESSVDDELAALKRKMQNQKRRK